MEEKKELLEKLLKKYRALVLNFKHLKGIQRTEAIEELSNTNKLISDLIKETEEPS